MSRGKWVCRYLFFALLLIVCLAFCGYCLYTIAALEAQTRSLAFVTLAMESMAKAREVLERIEWVRMLLTRGLIATGVVAGTLALLICWHIFSKKRANRPPKVKKAPKAAVAPVIPAQATSGAVCPHCGKPVLPNAAFCGSCGNKLNG